MGVTYHGRERENLSDLCISTSLACNAFVLELQPAQRYFLLFDCLETSFAAISLLLAVNFPITIPRRIHIESASLSSLRCYSLPAAKEEREIILELGQSLIRTGKHPSALCTLIFSTLSLFSDLSCTVFLVSELYANGR